MDTSSGLERLAQQPLDLSTSIGSRVSTANANVGSLTGQGIINAAGTMAPANAYSGAGNALTGIANSPVLNNAINSAFGNEKFGISRPPTAAEEAQQARYELALKNFQAAGGSGIIMPNDPRLIYQ
jgi:hypothetical protein